MPKQNLHGFIETNIQAVVDTERLPSPDDTFYIRRVRANAKGRLVGIWDDGYADIQRHRKNLFWLAAIALTLDLSIFKDSTEPMRILLTATELAAFTICGTKFVLSWHRMGNQCVADDILEPNPKASEDRAVYRAASRHLEARILKRILPRRTP